MSKIYYNSKIAKIVTFLRNFSTIMLFGAVFTEHDSLPERTESHERSHITQYQTFFTVGLALAVITMFTCFAFDNYGWWMLSLLAIPVFLYYIWYFIEYAVRLIMYRNSDKAYRMIAFEQEAYALQNEYLKPCQERRFAYSFSFFKYY